MSYVPSYNTRINWENEPSTASPINETNLNKMDYALYQHDQALQGQDSRISTLEGESKVTSFKGRTGAVTPADNDYTIAQIKATGTAGQVPTLNSQGKLEMADVPESGHEIVNPSGTSMPPRSKMKFMGNVSVSDDSANDQTVINVTGGGGGGGGGHTIQNPSGSSMTPRTNLQFTGTGVTVTDNSAGDKTVVNIDSSGHTIKDGDGTAMTPQPNVQFADANVSNDGTNNATVVKNFVDINWDDWQGVDDNDNTYYRVTDAPLVDGNVEVDLMTKLWENPAPTASFASQNITLDDNNYDYYVVLAYVNNSIDRTVSVVFKATDGCNIISAQGRAGGVEIYNRSIAYAGSNSIYTISDAYYAIGTTATYGNNALIIPYQILGIKQKVSISLSAIISNVSTSAENCMMPDGVTPITDAIKWKAHALNQTVTLDGSSKVTLPSEYNELLVLMKSSTVVYGRYNLSALELSSTPALERSCGYYEGANYNADVLFYKSNSQIYGTVRLKGTVVATTADVYYR